MKKFIAAVALVSAVLICAATQVYAGSWENCAAQLDEREKIASVGAAYFEKMAQAGPQGEFNAVWKISLSAKTPEERAAASCAIVKSTFPNGDSSKWEDIQGFTSPSGYIPKQLVAVNALFNAVIDLEKIGGDAKYAAVYLLNRFGESSLGKVYFVDTTTKEIRAVLDKLAKDMPLKGDWTTKRIKGKMPFVKYYDGQRSRDYADEHKLQYLDGFGRVSENGSLAWERETGFIYKIVISNH